MSEMNITEKIASIPSISTAEPTSKAAGQLSAVATLSGIFFEPGRTFESLRERPRFLLAVTIIALVTSVSALLLYQRVGLENIVRAQIEQRAPHLTEEQKERVIERQSGPLVKAISSIAPMITIPLFFAIGGGLYLLGVMAFGKTISYRQALSVWTYSSFPATLLMMLANTIFLYVQPVENIDVANITGGLVKANLSILVSATAQPVLSAALGAIDLFAIYGIVLAAYGLRKVARLSTSAATAIVVVIWLIGALARVALVAVTAS